MRETQCKEDETIRKFVLQMHEYQLSEIPEQKVLKEKYQLSELFYHKMKCLMRQQEKKARRKEWHRVSVAVVAVFVIVIGIVNPQYVAEAGNKVIEWLSNHVSFQFKEDTDVKWIPRYEMDYVPEGYELVVDEYYEGAGIIDYVDDEENHIYFVYGMIDGDMNLDNEEKEFLILNGEQEEKIYYLKAMGEEESSFVWVSKDKTTKFSVIGILEEEELFRIQKNIRISEKK